MRTDKDVIIQAMQILRLTVTGQTPEDTEYREAENIFNGVFAELQANEIIAWGNDETPDEAFYAFAEYLAQRAKHLSPDDAVRAELTAIGSQSYRMLIAAVGKKWSGKETSADDF